MIEVSSYSPEQTRALGRCLGQCIEKKGAILRLCGDLGSGKTCFVQGLAQGLGVPDAYAVTSPTYTLINEYPGRLPLYHIDLYRLAGHNDADGIGLYEILGDAAVVAVEWSERLPEETWPEPNLKITFSISQEDIHLIRLSLNGYGLGMDDLIREAVESWAGKFQG
jgi:tRNA threonylcarbamoyladenosine biosynthesis protein TsaE